MKLGSIVLLVYALLMLAGGLLGFLLANSKPSLIAGAASAIVLGALFFVSRTAPFPAYALGAAVSLLLGIQFFLRYQDQKKLMPTGMLLLITAIALGLLIYAAIAERRSG
jgi:uncharacterized membrane protein (UPF0136 family)